MRAAIARKLAQFQDLKVNFPTLDPYPSDKMYFGNVCFIGSDNATGIGVNLGRYVLDAHPKNKIILTGTGKGSVKNTENKGINKLEYFSQNVKDGNTPLDPKRTTVMQYDVLDPKPLSKIDVLVVCAAYMNPKGLEMKTFEEIPDEYKAESRNVIVQGFQNAVNATNFNPHASAFAVSYGGHTLPGYHVGPFKGELEDLIVNGERIKEGVRQNVLSFAFFESVAVLAFDISFKEIKEAFKEQNLDTPSLSEMVYGSIKAMHDKTLDRQIVHLDSGLRQALYDKKVNIPALVARLGLN